jgi:hypothetical protein
MRVWFRGSLLHSSPTAAVHHNGFGKPKPLKYSKTIAPVIDVFPYWLGVPYTCDTIKNKMEFLAGLLLTKKSWKN